MRGRRFDDLSNRLQKKITRRAKISLTGERGRPYKAPPSQTGPQIVGSGKWMEDWLPLGGFAKLYGLSAFENKRLTAM
jgi:hypothetical protein